MKISGAEYPISKIFSNDFVFKIPPYQRPYSWTTDEADALLDDLIDASGSDLGGEDHPYFLGAIVLAKEEDQSEAQVIDGQQRLTTLTILIASLAYTFQDVGDQTGLRKYLKQDGSHFEGIPDRMRLTLRDRDAEFFSQYIQANQDLSPLFGLDPAQLANDAQRNIQSNTHNFVSRLEALSNADRQHLAKFLITRCFLVAVSTPDSDSAYRIFSILNDRGLDLSPADIFKSEVIGLIPNLSEQLDYTERWEDLEDELGTDLFKALFFHLRTIFAGTKARDSLPREFRKFVLDRYSDKRVFVDDVLVPVGDVFAKIENCSWESDVLSGEINEWLSWLSRIDNQDWAPPAIHYLTRFSQEASRIEAFLRRLERLSASMFIRRCGANERIERYASVVREVEAEGDLLEINSAIDLSEEERMETLGRLNGDVYLETRTRLYTLLRLDASRSAGGASYDHKIITVEHVLPQNPAVGSEWMRVFTTAQRKNWCHKLANLVLLPRRKNSAARNFDFEKKKDKYFAGSAGASPFLLTMEVLQSDDWAPVVLQERQRNLLDQLSVIWEL